MAMFLDAGAADFEPKFAALLAAKREAAADVDAAVAEIIASAFADLGFEVEIGPLFATPEEVAAQAQLSDAHIVGVSSLAAGHLALAPALKRALQEIGLGEKMIVLGGVIPEQDFRPLREAGVDAIFPPGTVVPEAAMNIVQQLNERMGFAQRQAG